MNGELRVENSDKKVENSDKKIDFREKDYIDSLRYTRVGVLDQESQAEDFALTLRRHSPHRVIIIPIPGDSESLGNKYTVWKQLDPSHEEILDRISGRQN